jgi:hypothetical protein
MNYFWETYYIHGHENKRRPQFSYIINKQDAIINDVPKVLPEYEYDMLSQSLDENGLIKQPHISINRSKFNQSSLLEQRLAVHEFCRQVTQRGWIWPEYPMCVLRDELSKTRKFKETKYMRDGTFSIFANNGHQPAPGRKIIEHFFDLSEYSHIFNSPRMVMKMLNELAARRDLKFDIHNMLRIFSHGGASITGKYPTFRIFDPIVYSVIFKRMGIKGPILDIAPGLGNKSIAAAINGIKYFTIPTNNFSKAIEKGFAEFCELDYQPWNSDKVELLLYDNNFERPDMSVVNGFTKYAKRMMVFVPHVLKTKYLAKYKPSSIIKIKTKWFQKNHDYLFIW